MNKQDCILAFRAASEEIRSLRREKEILAAKVEVVNIFGALIGALAPRREHGYGEDIAWKLEHSARDLEKQIASEKAEIEKEPGK